MTEIKLQQHNICDKCVAEIHSNYGEKACYLGYGTKPEWVDGVMESIPTEPCPKTFNHAELITAIMLFNKNKEIHIEQNEPEFLKDKPDWMKKCDGCRALKGNRLPENACHLSYDTELRIVDSKIEIASKEWCAHPRSCDELFACEMMGYNKWARNTPKQEEEEEI